MRELEIAKKNMEMIDLYEGLSEKGQESHEIRPSVFVDVSLSKNEYQISAIDHKESCKRFLEFLEREYKEFELLEQKVELNMSLGYLLVYESWKKRIALQIIDFKDTIKEYAKWRNHNE
ncbi:hypothetical protein LCGC14_0632700 [marine sediment metagenome]|uniref:Uncharacterized protein n=1 Tax=marine sediment metagenome TaxID=412755 RepID=A0A0F9R1F4_9ZZZZ